MGELIRLKCEKCGTAFGLGIGHGMTDHDLDAVLSYFDPASADQIKSGISRMSAGDRWSYRKMIGYCDTCRSYFEIPTFHIINSENEQIVAAKCRCGNDCVLFDDDDKEQMAGIKCPECHGNMTVESAGNWD